MSQLRRMNVDPTRTDCARRIQECSRLPYSATEEERRLDDETLRIAELGVRGVLRVVNNGPHEVDLGRNPVDWRKVDQCVLSAELRGLCYRMRVIHALAVAYAHTRASKYAEAARDFLDAFMGAFPILTPKDSRGGHDSLTLGIRIANWAGSLPMLVDHAAFDAAFVSRVVEFLRVRAAHLDGHISTGINWRVFNADCLLRVALHLGFLSEASGWREHAVRVLNDAWFRQVLPDHVHYERNPSYHALMTKVFLRLFQFQQRDPSLGLKMSLEKLSGMHDFMLACTKPSGYNCGIHDAQSVFSGNVRDRFSEKVHEEAHKARDYFSDWKRFRREAGLPRTYPSKQQYYPDAGLLFSRTGWDEDASWISFDATKWGGGHCHLSRNSIQLHANRRTLVVDPGWLAYDTNAWAFAGRSTRAHNTCNLSGLNQQATNPTRTEVFHAAGYDGVFSVYEGGYWDTNLAWNFTHARNGIWAQHHRTMFWVQDRFMFVADSMYRLPWTPEDPEHERPGFEINWQLSDGPALDCAADGSRVAACWGASNLLLLFPIRPENAVLSVHQGEKNPLRGWLPGENEYIPAPQIRLNAPRMNRQHDYYVSILIPYASKTAPPVEVQAKNPRGQIGFVKLRWEDGTMDEIHWGCGFAMMLDRVSDFSTDSSLLHLRRDAAGSVVKGCMVNGTYLKPHIRDTYSRPSTIAF